MKFGTVSVLVGAALTSVMLWLCPPPTWADSARRSAGAVGGTYEGQPPVTEKELLAFLELLPQFRAWARAGNEEAHPVRRNGRPDFLYSLRAAAWVRKHGWDAVRFFCVMGRMAAALYLIEDGTGGDRRPNDMPEVAEEELRLARRHLGSMLKAGGALPPATK